MKRIIALFLFFTLAVGSIFAQTRVTPVNNATILLKEAAEGDFYIGTEAPVDLLYIGLANGDYHPIYSKGLNEILHLGNDANGLNITTLPNPIAAQDIATKNYVDTQVSGSIYNLNGSLNSDRSLAGGGFNLTESGINTHTTLANSMSLTSLTNEVSFAATNGVLLNNETTLSNDLSVTGTFIDSDGSPGDYYQLLSSTAVGTKWLYSSAAPKSVGLYTYQSPTNAANDLVQDWTTATTVVQTIPVITIGEESIVNVNFIFSFFHEYIPNDGSGNHDKDFMTHGDERSVYFSVNGNELDGTPVTRNYLSLTIDAPIVGKYVAGFYQGTCSSSNKLVLKAGSYTIELLTEGTYPIQTGSNSFNTISTNAPYNYTGWNFDVSVTPKSI